MPSKPAKSKKGSAPAPRPAATRPTLPQAKRKRTKTAQEPAGRKRIEPGPIPEADGPISAEEVYGIFGETEPPPHVHSHATPNRCCPDEPKEQVIQRLRENEPRWEAHPKDQNRHAKTGESRASWAQKWAAWKLTLEGEEKRG